MCRSTKGGDSSINDTLLRTSLSKMLSNVLIVYNNCTHTGFSRFGSTISTY